MDKDIKKEYGKLTLTLRLGDNVIVGDSLLSIVQLKNKQLRIQFNAPKDVKIIRTNVVDKIKNNIAFIYEKSDEIKRRRR